MSTQKRAHRHDRQPTTAVTEISADLIGSGQEGGLGDQVRAWLQRVRGGDMGALPAVGGFVVLSILFSILSPFFLTERNFANLLTQAATLVMLGMALVFVLLLGEIDLSAGVTGGVTMALFVVLVNVHGVPLDPRARRRVRHRHPHRHVHRLLRGEGRHPIVRRDAGPVPRLPGPRRSSIIGAGGLYRVQIPEIIAIQNAEPAGLGRLGDARGHPRRLGGDLVLDRARRTRAGVPNRTIALVWIKLGVIAVLGGAGSRSSTRTAASRSGSSRACRSSCRSCS